MNNSTEVNTPINKQKNIRGKKVQIPVIDSVDNRESSIIVAAYHMGNKFAEQCAEKISKVRNNVIILPLTEDENNALRTGQVTVLTL